MNISWVRRSKLTIDIVEKLDPCSEVDVPKANSTNFVPVGNDKLSQESCNDYQKPIPTKIVMSLCN